MSDDLLMRMAPFVEQSAVVKYRRFKTALGLSDGPMIFCTCCNCKIIIEDEELKRSDWPIDKLTHKPNCLYKAAQAILIIGKEEP